MLKHKKSIYVLLPIVVLVWGTIIYKVVDAFSDTTALVVTPNEIPVSTISAIERDTFSISTVTKDPFLGIVYRPKSVPKKEIPNLKKTAVVWPTITYKGTIAGQHHTVYVITINGIDQLLQVKERSTEGISLVKGTTTAIHLKYQGSTKRFQILK